jgi:hypothetical protein
LYWPWCLINHILMVLRGDGTMKKPHTKAGDDLHGRGPLVPLIPIHAVFNPFTVMPLQKFLELDRDKNECWQSYGGCSQLLPYFKKSFCVFVKQRLRKGLKESMCERERKWGDASGPNWPPEEEYPIPETYRLQGEGERPWRADNERTEYTAESLATIEATLHKRFLENEQFYRGVNNKQLQLRAVSQAAAVELQDIPWPEPTNYAWPEFPQWWMNEALVIDEALDAVEE